MAEKKFGAGGCGCALVVKGKLPSTCAGRAVP
jgi:hypothetical protein